MMVFVDDDNGDDDDDDDEDDANDDDDDNDDDTLCRPHLFLYVSKVALQPIGDAACA